MRLLLCCLIVLLTGAAGCQEKSRSASADASLKWNAARASVLYSLGKQQFESGNIDAARATVRQAITMDPTNAMVRLLSARIALEQNQLELAERELDVARASDPAGGEADYLSGIIHQRWQRPQAAYDFYASATEKAPAEMAYLLAKAEMLVALDRADEAIAILRDKVDYFEHSGALRDALGQLLLQKNQVAQGIDMLRQASIMSNDDLAIQEHLAIALCCDGQYREAEPILVRLLKEPALDARADLHLALGECQLNTGNVRAARSSYQKAIELNGDLPAAWLGLGRIALSAGDATRARLAAQKAVAVDPASAEAHVLLGYASLRDGRTSEASAAFQRAHALDPRDTLSLCMIGYLLEQGGQVELAMQYYARALRLNPRDELATRLMAAADPL